MNYFISTYSLTRENKIIQNGEVIFTAEKQTLFNQFIRGAYRQIKPAYPKFFKMDNLCKLAFINAEVIMNDPGISLKYPGESISIMLSNGSSSLESDLRHYDSIKDTDNYFPSPSVFVYTLPNIMSGEIAIRHKIKGENIVFISEGFDAELLYRQISQSLEKKWTKACLGGWVEQFGEHYESFMFLVEAEDSIKDDMVQKECIIFEAENIGKLYNAE